MTAQVNDGFLSAQGSGSWCLRAWRTWDATWWAKVTGGLTGKRKLRKRCIALLRRYDFSTQSNLDDLRARLESAWGKRIIFVPVHTKSRSPCGLWLSTAEADYVFFEASTSPLHQWHIIFHELGHMLFHHDGISPFTEEFLHEAMPTLDPQALLRVLGRSVFSATAEQEAEAFATMIGERGAIAGVEQPALQLPADTVMMLDRLAQGLAEGRPHW